MIRTRWQSAVVASACLLLAACAGKPQIPYDRSGDAPVKVIGLVTPYCADHMAVSRASSPGMSFGLVGALVETGLQARRESQFAESVAGQKLAGPQEFVAGLKRRLAAEGYRVVEVATPRSGANFLEQYPDAPAGQPVDAWFDVVMSAYGYVAAGASDSTPYRPFVLTSVRLQKRQSKTVLMQDQVIYNPINASDQTVSIPPDPQYSFVDFDALKADPVKAAAGVRQSLDATTQSIATLLK